MIELSIEAVFSISGGSCPTELIKNSPSLESYITHSGLIGSSIGFLIGIPLGYSGIILSSLAGSFTGIGIGTFQWWINQ